MVQSIMTICHVITFFHFDLLRFSLRFNEIIDYSMQLKTRSAELKLFIDHTGKRLRRKQCLYLFLNLLKQHRGN